ncbi:hypothetical protein, partial [uncultured Fibrobacter sp.]|uniref:hypothetical protein n=1 Tax=uncultured Fibrobacter sp. TaxID=261512 RepID=UPI0025F34DCF
SGPHFSGLAAPPLRNNHPSSKVVFTLVFLALELLALLELLIALNSGILGEDVLLSSLLQAARKGRTPRVRRLAMPKIWFDFM